MLDSQRLRIIHDLLQWTDTGPMIEVGCFNGGTVKFLALASARDVWAFDTFAGLPPKLDDEAGIESLFVPHDDTVDWLRECQNIHVCQGVFPASIPDDMPAWFSLVHLDGDLYDTTRAALQELWPRLSGFMVIDDFQRAETPGVERALNEVIPEWQSKLFAWHRWLNQVILQR